MFAHLSPEARAMLDYSRSDKIDFIKRDHYIQYEKGETIMRELQDALAHPKSVRMPCYVIIGDSKNGKSTLQHEFRNRNPTAFDAAGYPLVPVVWAEMPPTPKESRFWSALLISMSVAHRVDAKPERLEALVRDCLIERRVKMVILDEFHNVLHGTPREQRAFMAVVKRFHNALRITLVVSGTVEALHALSVDTQFVNRFEKLTLQKWSAPGEFLQLLNSFESMIPLPKPSDLGSPEKANVIFRGSAQIIGRVKEIILNAAIDAINQRKDLIEYGALVLSVEKLNSRRI